MRYDNGLLTITDFERDIMICIMFILIPYVLYKLTYRLHNLNFGTGKFNKPKGKFNKPKLKFKKNKYKVEIRGLDKLIKEYHAEETEDNNYIRMDGILMSRSEFIEFCDMDKEFE